MSGSDDEWSHVRLRTGAYRTPAWMREHNANLQESSSDSTSEPGSGTLLSALGSQSGCACMHIQTLVLYHRHPILSYAVMSTQNCEHVYTQESALCVQWTAVDQNHVCCCGHTCCCGYACIHVCTGTCSRRHMPHVSSSLQA